MIQDFENRVCKIEIAGDIMRYHYKAGEVTDYLTINGLLYTILTTYGVCPFLDDGRIKLQLQAGKTHRIYRLHDVAFACYHGHITDSHKWERELQAFLDWKNVNQLTIDHGDNLRHNNTIFNLSLMDGALNTSKSTIVARVRMPAYLNCAFCDGKYRVQLLQLAAGELLPEIVQRYIKLEDHSAGYIAALHFLCEDAETFVRCLKFLVNSRFEWAQPLKENGAWVRSDNPCWTQEIKNSLHAQKTLAVLDEKLFQPFVSTAE